ncbi:hypothetical protein DENIS_0657 [Desulfonema ishimotonii]|uniref:DUF4197 domain-containing protein n=1 Tax=Desulfonema ishimotonii TaxID=45657 RepID=A0A401FRY0_9BACT|nr:DUF4197 domain-containing protein [Desulfonema ishimotonii]GBC59716.1 hypothetical protein DENIS_0657 [Desulfonema ishimotonii]
MKRHVFFSVWVCGIVLAVTISAWAAGFDEAVKTIQDSTLKLDNLTGEEAEKNADTAEPAVAEEKDADTAKPAVAEEKDADTAEPAVAEEKDADTAEPAMAEEKDADTAEPAVAEEKDADTAEPAAAEEKSAPDATDATAVPASEADSQTVQGLKEALNVGIEAAVKRTGADGGFYNNPAIKILLPESLQKADAVIRKLGGEALSESLIQKMNTAAEKAAPQGQEIFINAISEMQFDDAMGILSGGDDAATRYLEQKTGEDLKSAFYPIVKGSMEEVGAIKTYNDYVGKYASNPLVKMGSPDINQYVTDEAISGLFKVLGEEEKKIRENPAARVTDLLKSVFGTE